MGQPSPPLAVGNIPQATIQNLSGYRSGILKGNLLSNMGSYQRGTVTAPHLWTRTKQQIRVTIAQQYALGKGGWNAMTADDWDNVDALVDEQLKYLANFQKQLPTLSEADATNRIGLYAEGTNLSYWQGTLAAARAAGKTQMKRNLNPAEHCQDCLDMALAGWVPLGALPMPGSGSRCIVNCKCTVEFR
jgi:hypothetical protein